jgi:hypothetical protein
MRLIANQFDAEDSHANNFVDREQPLRELKQRLQWQSDQPYVRCVGITDKFLRK